ncbi:MAG TPA: hypothetical protein VNN73_04440 [Blastocatellia bacterium]|jgi:hypothetical protein|nr:hypothetical protein [Blastocatellia bacterium]
MTMSEIQLMQEIKSLDVMIAVISSDMALQQRNDKSDSCLVSEMMEALAELRLMRSQRRFLLAAIETQQMVNSRSKRSRQNTTH